MAAIRRFLFTTALMVCLERAAVSKVNTEFAVNTMYQSGHGGKQVYDGSGNQSIDLYEPVLYINSQIDHNTGIFGTVVFDALSSASAKAFDSGTGASAQRQGGSGSSSGDGEGDGGGGGGWQTREGIDGGYSKKIGTWVFTPTLGFSSELSYRSVHGGFNAQKFFAEDNFVLTAGVFHFSDAANQWSILTDGFEGFKAKTTNSVNMSATQILSQNDIILGGVSYTRQSGFLGGTRNTVSTGTLTADRANEVLPHDRDKFTANARYIRSLGQNVAFHLDYRYYTDNWAIRAHTWEPSLAISFSDEKGVLRLLYRRYYQTPARYYADSFSGLQGFMTSDSDLAGFTANEGGAQVSYVLDPDPDSDTEWSWSASAVYYKRSNDLQALILQGALNAKF